MFKKIFLFVFLILLAQVPVFAEKIPVKITPAQTISTKHDETKAGECINFSALDNIYSNGKIIIKKGATIEGLVDSIHPNGWFGDYARITFNTFYATDENNQKMTITYPLTINGEPDDINNLKLFIDNCLVYITKGKEIYITPNSTIFTIFIEQ